MRLEDGERAVVASDKALGLHWRLSQPQRPEAGLQPRADRARLLRISAREVLAQDLLGDVFERGGAGSEGAV